MGSEGPVERAVMEARASRWKGRMEREIESRAAFVWMRDRRGVDCGEVDMVRDAKVV